MIELYLAAYMLLNLLGVQNVMSDTGSIPCPVSQFCSCRPEAGTDVLCDFSEMTHIPPFKPSEIRFRELLITGGPNIKSVADGSFIGISVTKLSLHKTNITSMGCEFFQSVGSKLESIDLRDNKLEHFPICALKGMNNIKVLGIRGNLIRALSNNVFARMTRLNHLDLSDNAIATMSAGTFRYLSELQTLNISGNQLRRRLPLGQFSYLKNLIVLDLSRNQIVDLTPTFCRGLFNLKNLYLRNNQQQVIDGRSFICDSKEGDPAKQNLEVVDLSENHISTLLNAVFLAGERFSLKLRGNSMKILPLITINVTDVAFNFTLDISTSGLMQSPLINFNVRKTCNLTVRIDVSHNKLTEIRPLTINRNSHRTNEIFSERFRLSYIARHNAIARFPPCYIFHQNVFEEFDIGHNLISVLPKGICAASAVYDLRIDNNRINTLNRLTYNTNTRLKKLDLRNNNITAIPLDMFDDLGKSLEEVDLRENFIQNFSPSLFDSVHSLHTVKLQGNPIACFCTKPEVATFKKLQAIDNVRCRTPSDRRDFMVKCAWINCTSLSTSVYDFLDSMCRADRYIGLDVRPLDRHFNLSWIISGPGNVTDLKVRITNVRENTTSLFIHLKTSDRFITVTDLAHENSYNICILATVSNENIKSVCLLNVTVPSHDNGARIDELQIKPTFYLIIIAILSGTCVVVLCTCFCIIRKYRTLKSTRDNKQFISRGHRPRQKSSLYQRMVSFFSSKHRKRRPSAIQVPDPDTNTGNPSIPEEETALSGESCPASKIRHERDTIPKTVAAAASGHNIAKRTPSIYQNLALPPRLPIPISPPSNSSPERSSQRERLLQMENPSSTDLSSSQYSDWTVCRH